MPLALSSLAMSVGFLPPIGRSENLADYLKFTFRPRHDHDPVIVYALAFPYGQKLLRFPIGADEHPPESVG